MHDPYREHYNLNIQVGLQDNAKELKPVNRDVFVGVSPKKRLARVLAVAKPHAIRTIAFKNDYSCCMTYGSRATHLLLRIETQFSLVCIEFAIPNE